MGFASSTTQTYAAMLGVLNHWFHAESVQRGVKILKWINGVLAKRLHISKKRPFPRWL